MKKIHQPARVGGNWDGHKVFLADDGSVVLADGSGATPDTTEDGPLVVDVTRPVKLSLWNGGLTAIIPVTVTRSGSAAIVHTSASTAKVVVAQTHMQVVVEEALARLLASVDQLVNSQPATVAE